LSPNKTQKITLFEHNHFGEFAFLPNSINDYEQKMVKIPFKKKKSDNFYMEFCLAFLV